MTTKDNRKTVAASSDRPDISESAAAILHGCIEQQFGAKIWGKLDDSDVVGRLRIFCNRLMSHGAMASRARWLAQCLAWGHLRDGYDHRHYRRSTLIAAHRMLRN